MSEERIRDSLLREFFILVEKMFAIDAIGTPLVNKQIIQLQLNQGKDRKFNDVIMMSFSIVRYQCLLFSLCQTLQADDPFYSIPPC